MQKTIYYVEEKVPKKFTFSGETTFKQYSNKWLEINKKQFMPKTYERYESLLKTINLGIGHIKLNNLVPYHLHAFYDKLAEDGANKKTGKGLSPKTILHHHRLISVILRQATRDKILSYNIADRDYIKAPKVPLKEARYLDEQEVQRNEYKSFKKNKNICRIEKMIEVTYPLEEKSLLHLLERLSIEY